jgi:tetratricopeptide (TPR) repeat protein
MPVDGPTANEEDAMVYPEQQDEQLRYWLAGESRRAEYERLLREARDALGSEPPDIRAAETSCLRAVELRPTDTAGLTLLAKAYYDQEGQEDQIEKLFRSACEREPSLAWHLNATLADFRREHPRRATHQEAIKWLHDIALGRLAPAEVLEHVETCRWCGALVAAKRIFIGKAVAAALAAAQQAGAPVLSAEPLGSASGEASVPLNGATDRNGGTVYLPVSCKVSEAPDALELTFNLEEGLAPKYAQSLVKVSLPAQQDAYPLAMAPLSDGVITVPRVIEGIEVEVASLKWEVVSEDKMGEDSPEGSPEPS